MIERRSFAVGQSLRVVALREQSPPYTSMLSIGDEVVVEKVGQAGLLVRRQPDHRLAVALFNQVEFIRDRPDRERVPADPFTTT